MSVSTIEQRETAMKTAQAQLAAANNALSVAEADRKSRDAERQELLVRIDRTGSEGARRRASSAAARPSSAPTRRAPASRCSASSRTARSISRPTCPSSRWPRLAVGMPAKLKLPGVERRGRRPGPARQPGGRQGEPHRQGPHRARGRRRTPISAPSPRARSISPAATASARRRPRSSATATRRALYVVRDGKVEERQVKPGIVEGDAVEIRSGVQPRARASWRAPPRSCGRATGCGRCPKRRRRRRLRRRTPCVSTSPPGRSASPIPAVVGVRGLDAARPRQLPHDVDHPLSEHRHPDRAGARSPSRAPRRRSSNRR